jgi:hypothetical protein
LHLFYFPPTTTFHCICFIHMFVQCHSQSHKLNLAKMYNHVS